MTSKKQTVEDVRRELTHRIQTEGVMAADQAALEICQDPKAPAPARATALTAMFRVGGYFKDPADKSAEKQPHEMDGHEMERAVAEAKRFLKARFNNDGGEDDGDLFD
jgi:hypothetical protein